MIARGYSGPFDIPKQLKANDVERHQLVSYGVGVDIGVIRFPWRPRLLLQLGSAVEPIVHLRSS